MSEFNMPEGAHDEQHETGPIDILPADWLREQVNENRRLAGLPPQSPPDTLEESDGFHTQAEYEAHEAEWGSEGPPVHKADPVLICPACGGNGTYLGQLFHGVQPCPKCAGEGYDKTIVSIPGMSDRDRNPDTLATQRAMLIRVQDERDAARAETAACIKFIESELAWEDFRSEGFIGKEAVSSSTQNCHKLAAFLRDMGNHGARLLADHEEAIRRGNPADNITLAAFERICGPELQERRNKQDVQWGGPAHDDTHDRRDWPTFIEKFMLRADADAQAGLFERYESNMIDVAALAIAAILSSRRKRQCQVVVDKAAFPVVKDSVTTEIERLRNENAALRAESGENA